MSGVEWAPELPESWSGASLKWLARIYAGGTPDRANLAYWTDGTIPWLNSGSVNDWSITEPSELISEEGLAGSSARWVPPGSVVIALAGQGKTKGTAARLEFLATTNQSMAAVVPNAALDYRYLHYWLASNYRSIRNLAGGDLRDGLNLQHIGSIQVPLPSPSVQQAIAGYLDRETAQIDTLIAKQEALIGTLFERRAATVEATFQGNYRQVPLRHVLALAQTGPFGTQLASSEYVTGGVPVINPTHIRVGRIRPDPDISVSEERAALLARFRVSAGDILLGRKGEVDKSAIVAASEVGFVCGSDSLLLRVAGSVLPEFLWWFLQSVGAHAQLERWSVGSTVAGLNQTTIASVTIPVPQLEEQRQMIDAIGSRTLKIDTLIAKAEQFIALAKERRSSLITAAVTGQINVSEAA